MYSKTVKKSIKDQNITEKSKKSFKSDLPFCKMQLYYRTLKRSGIAQR